MDDLDKALEYYGRTEDRIVKALDRDYPTVGALKAAIRRILFPKPRKSRAKARPEYVPPPPKAGFVNPGHFTKKGPPKSKTPAA